MVHRLPSRKGRRSQRGGKLSNAMVKILIICCMFGLYAIKLSTSDWFFSRTLSVMDFPTFPITLGYNDAVEKDMVLKRFQGANISFTKQKEQDSSNSVSAMDFPTFSNTMEYNEEKQEEDMVLTIFQEANVTLTEQEKQQLPSWSQITNQYGPKARLIGADQCNAFQQRTLVENRKLGIAGLTSTGTNLMFILMRKNCVPPPEVRSRFKHDYKSFRWQVPWGKHDPLSSQLKKNTSKSPYWEDIGGLNDTDDILHVVMVRNPYAWFGSVCNQRYVIDLFPEEQSLTLKYQKKKSLPCPYLIDKQNNSHPVSYKTRTDRVRYPSLAHVWNDWNRDYMETTNHTRIMVRMEDLVFHTYQIVKELCDCMGLMIRTDRPFQYRESSTKSHGSGLNMVGVWTKYGSPPPPRGGLAPEQYDAALQYLDPTLMDAFGYHHPPR